MQIGSSALKELSRLTPPSSANAVEHCGSDLFGEACEVIGGQVEPAFRLSERRKLLFLVGHARRKWDQVPMDVRVALLASEAQHVQALRRNHSLKCSTSAMNDGLQAQVVGLVEVADDALVVHDRRNHQVATQRWVLAEIYNSGVIAVRDMVEELRVATHKFAHVAARTNP